MRFQAAWALGAIGDAPAAAALSRALTDDDAVHVRRQAAWALGAIDGTVGIDALVGAQSRYSVSLHEPTGVEGEQALLESLPNEDADAGFDQIDKNSFYDYVATLIKELPEREQTILALYDFENLTLREIASLPSLTEARISQILGKLLLTL